VESLITALFHASYRCWNGVIYPAFDVSLPMPYLARCLALSRNLTSASDCRWCENCAQF